MSTARHATRPSVNPLGVLISLLKYVFKRRRPPVTPIGELLVEEFTPSQVASMKLNNRKAMWAIAGAVALATIMTVIYLIAIQNFVNAELGPMFDQLMKPLPGTPR